MPSPQYEQPALEGEVSQCMCVVEYPFSEASETRESSQGLCTEESSNPEEETKGMPEDTSADVVDHALDKPQTVMEVKMNANNNHDVISHKTPVNCAAKEYSTQESIVELGPELKEASDPTAECQSTSGMDCETPLTNHEEKLAKDQTFPKTTTAGEMLDVEAESSLQNDVDQQSKRMAKCSPVEPQEHKEPLPGSGIDEFDNPLATSVVAPQHFPAAVSVTSIPNNESPQDTIHRVPTPSTFDQEKHNFDSFFSFSETLDLAGALPQLFPETRTLSHVRRSSVPTNISTLVCSSLANLSLGDHTSTDVGENHCHCVEYSGPMPSPADAPSSKETAHYFPSEVDKDLMPSTLIPQQKESLQQACKEVDPESPQKKLPEKKGSPVKTTMILEKAVISGVKPDRLRIPLSSSKDRLSEFRLESGLPGDLKIQAIPEVDIEKDPSREASPIPPDNSFTFNVAESGGKAPPTPTSPKSPTEKPLEDATEQASIDGSKLNKQPGSAERPDKTAEVLIVVKSLREEYPQISIDCAVTHQSSPVTIQPQMHVEKEADRDNEIKITEEVKEEAEIPLGANRGGEEKPTTEEVRPAQSSLEDLESKPEGRSNGNQDRSDPGPATNTVPHMDQQPPTGCVEGEHIKEDHGREATPLESQPGYKEQGNIPGDDQTRPHEADGTGATPGEEPHTRNKNILDTDKGLLKLQGT